jgi:hypothetical protein
MNCLALTRRCVNVSYAGHELGSIVFLVHRVCSVSVDSILCGCVNCVILNKGYDFQLKICRCYSWGMVLNVDMDAPFDDT